MGQKCSNMHESFLLYFAEIHFLWLVLPARASNFSSPWPLPHMNGRLKQYCLLFSGIQGHFYVTISIVFTANCVSRSARCCLTLKFPRIKQELVELPLTATYIHTYITFILTRMLEQLHYIANILPCRRHYKCTYLEQVGPHHSGRSDDRRRKRFIQFA